MEHFWKDSKAGIDYRQFCKIFALYEIRLNSKRVSRGKMMQMVSEDTIKQKKAIYQ
jgi:hypothetical protein